MKVLNRFFITLLLIIPCLISCSRHLTPNLSVRSGFQSFNRTFSLHTDDVKGKAVHVNESDGPGGVWLQDVWFSTGTIEFDAKGRDVFQKSFVGIAFHGQNDSTYEAIYFRPFNFNSPEEIRRSHAVQYIFMPAYEWFTLRESRPGEFENPLPGPVSPEDWFHVKVVVKKESIRVFINSEQVLFVRPLSKVNEGKVGFWVGHGSDGTFANLLIQPSL